jgi:4-hydroxybenzoate polyprenyltransferase/phosphoserine phosphatase
MQLNQPSTHNPPLVVDLDGTLLKSDLLLETGLLLLRSRPLRAYRTLIWLLDGKARLKAELANSTELDVTALPYDKRVIEMIQVERGLGRRVVLATASHESLARQVADHLGLFDEVIATDGAVNLSGRAKRDALIAKFGSTGFDYVGNSSDDLPVWEAARTSHIVNAPGSVARKASNLGNVGTILPAEGVAWRAWFSALRAHQWMKNLLVLVPLLAAHRGGDASAWWAAGWAFLCFGLCASSVYLLNDLVDLSDDRHHPRKRSRSFAGGHLPLQSGLVAAPLLLAGAFGLSISVLPGSFTVTLAFYYACTLAYSFWLKRRLVVDVMMLAGLYTLRIVAGVAAIGAQFTFWLLAFSVFIFLSLALVKRYAELQLSAGRAESKVRGRGYCSDDLPIVGSMGIAAGYAAVLVLALYVHDPKTTALYATPMILWLTCPVLLAWISRVWMLAHRGLMHDDPVVFALRDRISLVCGLLMAGAAWWAS